MQKEFWIRINIFLTIFILFLIIIPTGYAEQKRTMSAQIKGKIINLPLAENYLYGDKDIDETLLYLLHSKEDLSMAIHASGSLLLMPADDRKQKISSSGEFVFNAEMMKPGDYYIFLQPVKGLTTPVSGNKIACVFIAKEKEENVLILNIPDQPSKAPISINLGNVRIMLP